MSELEDDQDEYFRGATLIRKRYRAWSDEWDHDHCEYCAAKFMDPTHSAEDAKFISGNPEILTEGYAVQGLSPDASGRMGRAFSADGEMQWKEPSPQGDDYWWICPSCAHARAERLELVLVEP
jgi:hypothetical protein